ncbi:hypothetical protein AYO40_01745 [Planctomycetaceae bacterium SCGC AG-212-D15]|nr:hypothetical protein AYO40_01745 [Planctomycetaceae bacterium SCGC AG-212-D15]
MTEQEWLTSTDWLAMCDYLDGRHTTRKDQLFACSFGRVVWHLLADHSKELVERGERFADGCATEGDLFAVCNGLTNTHDAAHRAARAAAHAAHHAVILDAATAAGKSLREFTSTVTLHKVILASRLLNEGVKARLLRDITGNPFRPVSVARHWLTHSVVTLANCVYVERAFDQMPILGDALEEAGCTDASILEHCRASTPHVKGCWVVDLLLGKL